MGLYITISILIFIVCVLLILIVLVQNSKGGGLASSFSSSNQVLGVKKTTDFLEKSTWVLASSLLVLTLSTVFVIPRSQDVIMEDEATEVINEFQSAQPMDFQPAQFEQEAAPAETAPAESQELPQE